MMSYQHFDHQERQSCIFSKFDLSELIVGVLYANKERENIRVRSWWG